MALVVIRARRRRRIGGVSPARDLSETFTSDAPKLRSINPHILINLTISHADAHSSSLLFQPRAALPSELLLWLSLKFALSTAMFAAHLRHSRCVP